VYENDLFAEIFNNSGVGRVQLGSGKKEDDEEMLEQEEMNIEGLIKARQNLDVQVSLGNVKIDETDVEQVMLKDASDHGFDLRCSIGQVFSSTGGKTSEYRALKGTVGSRQKQATFRKQWAEKKLHHCIEEKLMTTAWKRVDIAKGVYRPFTMVWKKEGGDRAAYKATLKLVAKSIKMGGAWVRRNEQTERFEFLHMQHSTSDIFEQAWSECTKWTSGAGEPAGRQAGCVQGAPAAAAGAAADADASAAPPPAAAPAAKATAKASAKASASASAPAGAEAITPNKSPGKRSGAAGELSGQKGKKGKSSLDEAVGCANKQRDSYFKLKTQLGAFLDMVKADEKWAWVRVGNGINLQALHEGLAAANKFAQDDFSRQFLAMGVDKKDGTNHAQLEVSLKKFASEMTKHTATMSLEIERLKKMHNVR
jgi:hypothetical protein